MNMQLFGEYFKKDNLLTNLDARIKLLVGMAALLMVLSYKGFVFPLFVIVLNLVFCAALKIPLRVFILRFCEAIFIAGVIICLKLFFSKGVVLFCLRLPGFTLCGSKDGLLEGLVIALRIFAAVSVVAVLGFSTPFTEFIVGLSWLRVPRAFIEVLMFAYRYIFVLLEDAWVIYSAQKNRLGYSGIKRGLKSFGVLSGSLVLKAFEHSQTVTISMLQRGYDGNIPQQKYKPFKTKEVIYAVLAVTVMAFLWKI